MRAEGVELRLVTILAADIAGFARQVKRLALILVVATVTLNGNGLTLASTPGDPPRIAVLLYNSLLQHGGPEHPVILGLRDVGLVDG